LDGVVEIKTNDLIFKTLFDYQDRSHYWVLPLQPGRGVIWEGVFDPKRCRWNKFEPISGVLAVCLVFSSGLLVKGSISSAWKDSKDPFDREINPSQAS
jgi:hypothetical protein